MTVKLEVETKTSLNGIKVGAYGELAAIRYNMKDLEHTVKSMHLTTRGCVDENSDDDSEEEQALIPPSPVVQEWFDEHTAEPHHDRDTDPVCEESSVALQHERGTEDDERGTEDAADALEADSDTIELIEVEYV
jgi:hypothetical protein